MPVPQSAVSPVPPETLDKIALWNFLRLCHGVGATPEWSAATYVEEENPSADIEQVQAIARYAWKDFDRQRKQLMARRHRPSCAPVAPAGPNLLLDCPDRPGAGA